MTVALPRHELISSILQFRAYLDRIGVDEFQSCRAGLEIRAAELAASFKSEAERRAALEPLVDQMREATDDEERFNAADLAFHLTVARLSDNSAIELLLASLNDLVRASLVTTYQRVLARFGARGIRTAVRNHERIAAAIIDGDGLTAARAMEEHFRYVRKASAKARSRR